MMARVDSANPVSAAAHSGHASHELLAPEAPSQPVSRQVDALAPSGPAHRYDVPRMLTLEPPRPPDDFSTFWQRRYQTALRVPPDVAMGPPKRVGEHDVRIIHYNGIGGRRLGGYLALPVGRVPDNAVLYVHGYGGCGAPTEDVLRENGPASAMLFGCVRGFGLSAGPDVPSDPQEHVIDGIASRDTYEIGDSVADVWSGASALLAAVPSARERLYLDGTSFGGGVAALAVAWDERFARAFLEVPTFGAQELRLRLPTTGSGAAVQRLARRPGSRALVERTLAYFDAACAARFTKVPTMVAAAESDAVVTPPGQFSIYNALRRSLRADDVRLYVMRAGHAPLTAQEGEALTTARRRWFGMD